MSGFVPVIVFARDIAIGVFKINPGIVRLKSSEHDTSKSNADLSIFSGINYFYFVSQSPIK